MRLLYPCDPFEKKKPDEAYEEEFNAAKDAGVSCSLFSEEDFDQGEFRPRPPFSDDELVLYRGWMLTPERYAKLLQAIEHKGGKALTSVQHYRLCHYLPEWYGLCKDLTPNTLFLTKDADFSTALAGQTWSAYFIKDYVKSLTTARGSVAKTLDEIPEIVSLIEKYRGQVEGGVCVRQFEALQTESEERYFVLNGKAFSRNDVVPEIVEQIAVRIDSPFFSIDIAAAIDGTLRLIELGDGQVSDRKKWPADRFVSMLKS